MSACEVNFDGIVGPTHNYSGLSKGNIASENNAKWVSNPRKAALQGLGKMKALMDLGNSQGILLPHLRPHLPMLHALGFRGTDRQMMAAAWSEAPDIARACFSASPMWTANAATVSPWLDARDGRTHFTPANLSSMFHRSFESAFTGKMLKRIFADERHFAHHSALPSGRFFGDEGAANHTRLGASHGERCVEVFTYGASEFSASGVRPEFYPARQSREACEAVARLHGLNSDSTIFVQQNPNVIDQGVFHNDVIAVGTTHALFFHEHAFVDKHGFLSQLKDKLGDAPFYPIEVKQTDVDVATAVASYLFNTQLIEKISLGKRTVNDANSFTLIAPSECEESPRVSQYLDALVQSSSPIDDVRYFDLRESMRNGGGPACLRLRVVMSAPQVATLGGRVILDDTLYGELVAWVGRHYRDRLAMDDLRDPDLIDECRAAHESLEEIVRLPGLYS